jgi:trimeric autotransporter adhesin
VSWQLTGVRHDAWADAHRIPVEQMKAERERGFYMHPELFGAGLDKSVAAARHPGMKLTLKNAQHQNPIN